MKKSLVLFSFALSLCVSAALAQDVTIAGSSTVYPISLSMAEEYAIESGFDVAVESTGTGGGFTRFCAGETAINNASRPIEDDEYEECAANGIAAEDIIEIPVAFDALTVAVNPEEDFVQCLDYEQLGQIWQDDNSGPAVWSDIIEGGPEEEISLYGPSTGSGTLDYFVEEVLEGVYGEEANHTADYFPSEEDDVLAENVAQDPYGLVYLGYAYYASDPERLKALEISGEDGQCVSPSVETIEDNTYPLSRPLLIYVNRQMMNDSEALRGFVEFYLSEDSREFISDTGYALLDDSTYEEGLGSLD